MGVIVMIGGLWAPFVVRNLRTPQTRCTALHFGGAR